MSATLKHVKSLMKGSGKSGYRISKETGCPQSQLSRFMRDETKLSIDSVEAILDCLGYEITIAAKAIPQPKAKKSASKKKAAKKKRRPKT